MIALCAPLALAGCSGVAPEGESVGSVEQALNPDVPYRLQAESYTAFLDNDNVHNGNCGSGALDQETTSDPNGGGCDVGWTAPGEWIEYYITTASPRSVNLVARTASANSNKTLHFMLDGQNVGGSLTAPNAGWQAFADRTAENVALTQGGHTLRVVFDTGDTNLNYIDITPPRIAVPARLEAENYQHGWETTPATNSGGACERGDGIDKETTSDAGGGCNVGWTAAGEWLDYDFSLSQAQNLDFTARVASGLTGKALHLTLDGNSIGGSLTAPSSGWQSFQDRAVTNIPVSAGNHTLRVVFDSGDTNLNYINVTASGSQARQRKGLAVIADFANQALESYTGTGFKSVADINTQLDKMKQHWSFLSHNTEQFTWDVVRVTLPVSYSTSAYASTGAFREAVIKEVVKPPFNPANYDLNSDGVMDTVWIIASGGTGAGANAPGQMLFGGSTINFSSGWGAANFVDAQGSGSVQSQVTGAFNHEVGHCLLGLPDIYGDYGTLHQLTIMDDPYPLPGQDFTAWERTKAGWSVPTVLTQSTTGVTVNDSNLSFDSVKVPGLVPNEYWLIEYRNRPDSGFGSGYSNVDYNGLAIYHVLEGSNQNWNPPLLKLEAADGSVAPGQALTLQDFAYPGNPAMQNPLILRSYFGGGEVFRITNVTSAGTAMRFDATLASPTLPTNLLANASFEQGSGSQPSSWTSVAWEQSATFGWSTSVAASGTHSVSIATTSTPNDARWYQTVNGLTVGQTYAACGKLKGQNIVTTSQAPVGANIFSGDWNHSNSQSNSDFSNGLLGTFDWSQSCVIFTADQASMPFGCRLGFTGSTVTGSLWCDDLAGYQLVRPF